MREAAAGDESAARKRLDALKGIPLLAFNEDATILIEHLAERGPMPEKAKEDGLHIAFATAHGMDYLLTWNCRHIANAEMRRGVEAVCSSLGYEVPVIATPEELMGS